MTDLQLVIVVVLVGFVFLSWQLDRILTAVKRSGYDADATGYLLAKVFQRYLRGPGYLRADGCWLSAKSLVYLGVRSEW